LPLMPASFATYDRRVIGIAVIRSAPTALESTTHVFGHGLDLYSALLRPARGFDLLADDFSFAALLVALLGLATAVAAMSQVVRAAQLKAKWQ
jgi:ER membrane protein complex subunit 1